MRYVIFHKPYGVLSQFTDESGHPGLKQFIPVPDIYPVGRLDHDSEGLLLLTDDGILANRVASPHFEHPKTYWAQVEGTPDEESLAKLRQGVEVQGQLTLPAEAHQLDPQPTMPDREPPIRVRKSIPTSWIAVVLREGRNRQVRKMTAAVGLPTLRLVRVGIGPLTLGELAPGQWRDLTEEELDALKKMVSGPIKPGAPLRTPRRAEASPGRETPRGEGGRRKGR